MRGARTEGRSIIIPATGVTTLPKFLLMFMERIAAIWVAHGVAFDASNQSVVFFFRSNRSLIGSMNDAISQVRLVEETAREENRPMDWKEMEVYLNQTPYGSIKYDRPRERLKGLLSEAAC
ncbi:MAG: hypothetical protein ACI8UO_005447 [Verrucomicrobiales bacterium]